MARKSSNASGSIHDAFEPIDTPSERRWLSRALRDETFGGVILLLAALLAMIIANSPLGDWYAEVRDIELAIPALNLSLPLAKWSSDGLLAIFFFVAGLELKHEFVHGSLNKPKQALVPIVAAISGMALPAIIFSAVVWGDSTALKGWATPVATDIAFALAVLAVAGRGLPTELRAFLLALAVIDDLGAITIIALFYSHTPEWGFLLLAAGLLLLFALLQRFALTRWYLMIPLALAIWWATFQSGIHATVAGVALALATSVKARGQRPSPAEIAENRIRPISVGFAVPLFAFTAAGVDLRDLGFGAITAEISLAVIAGLVIGKPLGVMLSTYLLTRFTSARLNENIRWADLLGLSFLAGIGFTVSLLIGKLSFAEGSDELASGKMGVLTGSLISALLAIIVLQLRRRPRDRSRGLVR